MASEKQYIDIDLNGNEVINLKADTLNINVNAASDNPKRIVYWNGDYYFSDGTSWISISQLGLTSVGLSMPSAFSVANSPLTSNGTIGVTGAGNVNQYIDGTGALQTFPTSIGGGTSVAYYLNGGTNQGTFGGGTYYEMSAQAVIGTNVDFSLNADGLIAQFITDPLDPNETAIPQGAWNFQLYFSASSSGGTPQFYVELYTYDGATFSFVASSVTNPETITGGTSIDLYSTNLSVPLTPISATDRLAIRVYVIHDGRTITLHTQAQHLDKITTTFSFGLTRLNGLTNTIQYLKTGTSGTDFNIDQSGQDTHVFNLPVASSLNTGKLSNTDWQTFYNKFDLPTFTLGSVLFSDGTTIAQDNANFFWDTTNKYLGIGTNTPNAPLQVLGPVSELSVGLDDPYLQGNLYHKLVLQTTSGDSYIISPISSSISAGAGFSNPLGSNRLIVQAGGSPYAGHYIKNGTFDFAFQSVIKANVNFFTIKHNYVTDNRLGVNTASPVANLDVNGNSYFRDTITILDNKNIVVGTANGTKIGTSTGQKLGFFGATPIVQPSAVVNPQGIADALYSLGLLASSTINSITVTNTGSSGPAIYTQITNTLNIPDYSTALSGYVPTSRTISTTAPLSGGGDLSANRTLSISQANSLTDGYLSATDWNIFNNKQNALTFGNLTESTSSVLTISGGTGAVIGSGTSIQVKQASSLQSGFLSSSDWSLFNGKQNAITLTVTGNSGSATFISNTLNIPTYTLSGLGGQPLSTNLTSLSALTFASTSFVKMTAAGTFALDTNTYLTSATGLTSVWSVKTQSGASYSAANNDYVLINAATQTVTLPSATANARVGVKMINATVTNIQVKTASAGVTIDGTDRSSTGLSLYNQYDAYVFVSDGTNWWIES